MAFFRQLSLIAIFAIWHPQVGKSAEWTFMSEFVNSDFECRITDKMLDSAPRWDRDISNPPLSARKALLAAERQFKTLFSSNDWPDWDVQVTHLVLRQLRPDQWVWGVSYGASYSRGELKDTRPALLILVLMNGEVVPQEVIGESNFAIGAFEWTETSRENEVSSQPQDVEVKSEFVRVEDGAVVRARYAINVTSELLKATPEWKAENEDPPVPAATAVRLAESEMRKLLGAPLPQEWVVELESAVLHRGAGNKWYWVVGFQARDASVNWTGRFPWLNVCVLMDNQVLKIEKRDK